MILALALHAAVSAQLATPLDNEQVILEVATDQVSVAYSDYLVGETRYLLGGGVAYGPGLVRAHVGLETWPIEWITLRLDGGPLASLESVGFNARALTHLVFRIDAFQLYTGPGLDLAWSTESARAKATGDLGVGLQFRELGIFAHGEAGMSFTGREGTAVVGRASLMVRARF